MTDQDKDAIIGRAVRADKENEANLAALKSYFRDVGECLEAAGKAINGANLFIEFNPTDIIVVSPINNRKSIPIEYFDLKNLHSHIEEYRICIEKKKKLHDELVQLGIRPSPIEIDSDNVKYFKRGA